MENIRIIPVKDVEIKKVSWIENIPHYETMKVSADTVFFVSKEDFLDISPGGEGVEVEFSKDRYSLFFDTINFKFVLEDGSELSIRRLSKIAEKNKASEL